MKRKALPYRQSLIDDIFMLTGEKLGSAIREAIRRKGVTQVAVAEHFGVRPPSVQDWIRRGTIGKDKLPELWAYFADVVGPEHWGMPGTSSSPAPHAEDEEDLVIAQYSATGAMGHGYELEDNPPGLIRSWRVTPDWLRLNVPVYTSISNLCIVTGFGPSMKPRYNPGDPLLCDRGFKTVDADGVYFFRVDGHAFIKQLQRIPTRSGLMLRAKSFNPDYDPFDIDQSMDFQVFGKILTAWRSEQF